MSGMPSTNSLHSLYNFVHVPWVQAQLSRIQARVGKDQFPIVKTTMLPNAASLRRYRDFPAIIISGNRNDARLRVRNREQVNIIIIFTPVLHMRFQIEDVIPILQQTKEYLLVQPMIQPVYELHIIRIGERFRC